MTIEDVVPSEELEVKDDEFIRSELQTQLRDEILEVTFTKVNGDKRVMNCTLMEQIMPTTEDKKDTTEKKVNEDILSVWDIDAKGWRSFRINTVTRVRQHGLAGYNHA